MFGNSGAENFGSKIARCATMNWKRSARVMDGEGDAIEETCRRRAKPQAVGEGNGQTSLTRATLSRRLAILFVIVNQPVCACIVGLYFFGAG